MPLSTSRPQALTSFEEIARKAFVFDLTDVKRSYQLRHSLSNEVVTLHERELKRYLILCALHPDRTHSMFSQVDDLWHEFICFTRKYHRFCSEIAGRYIHHAPRGAEDGLSADALSEGRFNTLADYRRYFGEPDSLWLGKAEGGDDEKCAPEPSCSEPVCSGGGPEKVWAQSQPVA